MKRLIRVFVLSAGVIFVIVAALAMLQLQDIPVDLPRHVNEATPYSGVSHPVTAVLLNFRGYDTLLEIAVLMLAVFGVLVTAGSERHFSFRLSASPQPLLQSMTRRIVPLMIMVAGYLFWAGSHRPGGAFQAGAVLAAAIVLLYLSGQLFAWTTPGPLLRTGLAAGFVVFLLVAASLLFQGSILQYPAQYAGSMILLIEAGLTLSLGLVLAGLFLWLPNENEEAEE